MHMDAVLPPNDWCNINPVGLTIVFNINCYKHRELFSLGMKNFIKIFLWIILIHPKLNRPMTSLRKILKGKWGSRQGQVNFSW
jgi:hypothetical protein